MRRGAPSLNNVIGALDGTFVFVSVPTGGQGPYFGYKHPRPALLLMAICDHNLKFRWFDATSVGSAGDQAAFKRSSVAFATDNDAIRNSSSAAAAKREDQLLASSSSAVALPSTGGIDLPPPQEVDKATTSRLVASSAWTSLASDAVAPGYVLVCDGGIAESPWMVRVGTEADLRAFKRTASASRDAPHGFEASILTELEYCNFVISSHRIHVERAFGRFFNSFKAFRGGRFKENRMADFVKAAMVVHNFVICDLEAAEAAVLTALSREQHFIELSDEEDALDAETLEIAASINDEVRNDILATVLRVGRPQMALVHSESSKATVKYIREEYSASATRARSDFSVRAPAALQEIEAGAETLAGPRKVSFPDKLRLRRWLMMRQLFSSRRMFEAETGVSDAAARIRRALAADLSVQARGATPASAQPGGPQL